MSVSAVDHCSLCLPDVLHPKDDKRPPAIIFLDIDGVMKWKDTSPESFEKHFPDFSDCEGEGYLAFVKKRSILAGRELNPNRSSSEDLNCSTNYLDYCHAIVKGRDLDPASLASMQQLIKRVEDAGKRALVVISSKWRNDATTRELRYEVFNETPFGKYICGKAAPTNDEIGWTPECKFGGEDFEKHAKEQYELNLRTRADVIAYWLKDHKLEDAPYVILDDQALEIGKNRFGKKFIRVVKQFDQSVVDKACAILCNPQT